MRGNCVATQPPYPEGVCVCKAGFSGGACESTVAILCPPGSGVVVEAGTVACSTCKAGFFSSSYDDLACQPCPLGYVQPAQNATGCEPCKRGQFQPEVGSPCALCAHSTSSGEGASKCDVCAAGHWLRKTTGTCEQCPTGSSCAWNTTVETILVHAGHWRLSPFSARLYRCQGSNSSNASACAGSAAGSSVCLAGHSGARC